jgi:hypothetical protein
MSDHSEFTDSAGRPWEGRNFSENKFASDNGLADEALMLAITEFQAGTGLPEQVISAFAEARLLIPLIANLGDSGEGSHGLEVDKSADLSIVTVGTPDGQTALPVFSSVEAMLSWNPNARPVPNFGRQVAFAAASEGNTRIVLDPMAPSEFVIRRPGIAHLAQGFDWVAPYRHPEVTSLVQRELGKFDFVDSFALVSGDSDYRLRGQELLIELYLEEGVGEDRLRAFEQEFFASIATSEKFVELVDSVAVKFLAL